MYDCFSHSVTINYYAKKISWATFIKHISAIFVILMAIAIGLFGKEIWWIPDSYIEQPTIKYTSNAIFLLNTMDKQYTWSTIPIYNTMNIDHVKIVLIEAMEEDDNYDGLFDSFHMFITIPSNFHINVKGFSLLIFFKYQLKNNVNLTMKTMALISSNCPSDARKYYFYGLLQLVQKEKVEYTENNIRYNIPDLNAESMYNDNFEFSKIIKAYSALNVSTYLRKIVDKWEDPIKQSTADFILDIHIRYPVEYDIKFKGHTWLSLKWNFITYISIFVLFWYFRELFLKYVLQRRLIQTVATCSCGCDI